MALLEVTQLNEGGWGSRQRGRQTRKNRRRKSCDLNKPQIIGCKYFRKVFSQIRGMSALTTVQHRGGTWLGMRQLAWSLGNDVERDARGTSKELKNIQFNELDN